MILINLEELQKSREETKNELLNLLKLNRKVCVVRPCSWGKSHLIMELCKELKGNKLILEPTNILEDYIKKINSLNENINSHIYISTYQNLLGKNEDILKTKYENIKYIFLDEVHRCGAKKWNNAVQTLLKAFPNAKVIGMSATPIRTDGNDVVESIFDNIQVSPMYLGDAIKKGILPNVHYVSALYTITKEYNDFLEKINKNENVGVEKKSLIIKEIHDKFLQYEELNNIPNILQKHLFLNTLHLHNMKIIVFVERIKDIVEAEELIKKWFYECYDGTGIKKKVNIYSVHCKNSKRKNKKIVESFEESHLKNDIDVLISVNMCNEGLHLKNVNCIMMLRKTASSIVYLQELGRVISQENNKPIVFDFVNNCNFVNNSYISLFEDEEYVYDIEEKNIVNRKTKDKLKTKNGEILNIHDYIRDFQSILEKLSSMWKKYQSRNILIEDVIWLGKNARFYNANELEERYQLSRKVIEKFLKANNIQYILGVDKRGKDIKRLRSLGRFLYKLESKEKNFCNFLDLVSEKTRYKYPLEEIMKSINIFSINVREKFEVNDRELILKVLLALPKKSYSITYLKEHCSLFDLKEEDFYKILIQIYNEESSSKLPSIKYQISTKSFQNFLKQIEIFFFSQDKITELSNIYTFLKTKLKCRLSIKMSDIKNILNINKEVSWNEIVHSSMRKKVAKPKKVRLEKSQLLEHKTETIENISKLYNTSIENLLKILFPTSWSSYKIDKIKKLTIEEIEEKDLFYFKKDQCKKTFLLSRNTYTECAKVKQMVSVGYDDISISEMIQIDVNEIKRIKDYFGL